MPRRTFTAPQQYWDSLDAIVTEGRATNGSDALRHVIDAYRRSQQHQALAEAAGRLDDNDWLSLTGFDEDGSVDDAAPPWSQLVTDQQD